MSLFHIYEALWRRIESDGVWVHYNGLDTDEGGHFVHDGCGDQGKPEIQLTRSFYREPMDAPSEMLGNGQPANIKGELLTLAHEYGHCLSWQGGTPHERWNEYHAAVLHQDAVAGGDGWEAVPTVLSHREKQLVEERSHHMRRRRRREPNRPVDVPAGLQPGIHILSTRQASRWIPPPRRQPRRHDSRSRPGPLPHRCLRRARPLRAQRSHHRSVGRPRRPRAPKTGGGSP
jgi:hypothetical protein